MLSFLIIVVEWFTRERSLFCESRGLVTRVEKKHWNLANSLGLPESLSLLVLRQ